MSKPTPEGTAEEAAPPAFATKPAPSSDRKADAVQDLEKRLAMLGGPTNLQAPPPAMPPAYQAHFAPPAAAPPAAEAPAAMKGGKNALLVSDVAISGINFGLNQ